jgi:hypothetical protein
VSKVRRALLSPIGAGTRTHDGQPAGKLMRPDGTPWPAILTPAQRDEVDRALKARYGRRPSRWHTPNPGLLSGLAVCAVCGHNLTPRRYGGRRADGYTCQADGGGRCGSVGISMPRLDELVTEMALTLLDSKKLRKKMARPRKAPKRAGEDDPAAIAAEMEELAEAAGRGAIPVREYLAARKPLEARHNAAVAALNDDDDHAELAPLMTDPVAAWDRLTLDGQRAVLAVLLDRVEVHPATSTAFDPERVEPIWRV